MRLPSADQRDFADTVGTMLSRRDLLAPLRRGPGRRELDVDAWQALLALGVLEPVLDDDILTTCLVAEQLGEHVAPVPFLSALVTSVLLQGLDARPEQSGFTHGLFAGDGRATAPRLHLADGLVSGTLPFVPDADVTETVVALTEDGTAVAVSIADTTVGELVCLDATQPFDALHLEGVPATVLCDDRTQVEQAVSRAVDIGVAAHCSSMVGLMSWMLDTTVMYTKQRVQFGQPIASRQAVKHACAKMLARTESSRAATFELATAVADRDRTSIVAPTTKSWVCDSADEVAAHALQLHGGIGFTWEHDLHHYFKRATVGSTLFGTAPYHRQQLASRLMTPLS